MVFWVPHWERRTPSGGHLYGIASTRHRCTTQLFRVSDEKQDNTQNGGRSTWLRPPFRMVVRRCPTLPPRLQGSTIGAERLSFRVRNVAGRFPLAMAAVTL